MEAKSVFAVPQQPCAEGSHPPFKIALTGFDRTVIISVRLIIKGIDYSELTYKHVKMEACNLGTMKEGKLQKLTIGS